MMAANSFKVLSVNDAAAEYIRDIMSQRDDNPVGLRIGIKKGGCAGMEYTMSLVDEPVAGDDVVEEKGVTIFVEPSAVLYLLGTELGYEATKFKSGLTFKNPNEVSACGCGESVELSPSDLPQFNR
ncbi:iron-sulfur cluster assembly accessory protein [Rhodobacteraceae bacterium RKSG542]|uniref:HesB/IscA family protein n=1 Tax=Pseudovibrio flavus TaxID=2529854 RepID=UPI0012BBC8A4|nr:iron-sulfur cluster assembly accessory protein [Pseudovibrio flavus]MTI15789.1 iron-sulfur cluster assembly accessory protein [Pseudovibrio flavus]